MHTTTIGVAAAETLDFDEVIGLYDSVGWSVYTKDPARLALALAGSSTIVVARESGAIVGLARVVSDGASIAYLQDVLVRPGNQREGIGRRLVDVVLGEYADVRQKVLLTDDEPAQRAFYEALGFSETRDVGAGTLRAFVRFD
jgi:GNAT superfamily N-acetyltransferase